MRWGVLVLASLAACDGGSVPDCDRSEPTPRDAGPLTIPDAGAHDGAGDVWEGYAEAWRFPSGSDRVRIVFDTAPAGDGPRTGVVIFGDAAPPPPPTSPDVGYPEDALARMHGDPVEGLVYPITRASIEGDRMEVAIDLVTLWTEWCAMQPPVPLVPGRTSGPFACVPNQAWWGGHWDGPEGLCCGEDTTVTDCVRMELCSSSVCECDATSCHAGHIHELTLEVRIEGTEAAGTIALDGGANLFLTLQ